MQLMWDDTRRLLDAIDPIGPIGIIHNLSFVFLFFCFISIVFLCLLILGRDLDEQIRMTLKSAIECNDVDDCKTSRFFLKKKKRITILTFCFI